MSNDETTSLTDEDWEALVNSARIDLEKRGNEESRYLTDEECDALISGVAKDDVALAQAMLDATEPRITRSLEQLSHFRCGHCKGWWSIGDWHVRAEGRKTLYCPWCGTLQEVEQ